MDDAVHAIYDFELLPYALGDVLTWNVQTAIACEEAGRSRVEVHICLDQRAPASPYQRDLVSSENSGLFFSELSGAFGTHPKPGTLRVWHRREQMLAHLRAAASGDPLNSATLAQYEQVLAQRSEQAVIDYFGATLHSHARINEFARAHGALPWLRGSLGCEVELAALRADRFAGKRVVSVHMRLRRVDAGYGAPITYARDADFLEWYEFLKDAGARRPDVQFVVLGRLQEKPLELLALPNVLSLRSLGLGLGHELTLLRESELFLGSSSGFAAMANFSPVPYFITHLTPQSCRAYGVPPGAPRLPFASERQTLVYEPESCELLSRLLESALPS